MIKILNFYKSEGEGFTCFLQECEVILMKVLHLGLVVFKGEILLFPSPKNVAHIFFYK